MFMITLLYRTKCALAVRRSNGLGLLQTKREDLAGPNMAVATDVMSCRRVRVYLQLRLPFCLLSSHTLPL